MEQDEVITNFTDSESDNEADDVIRACCQETDRMIDSMKQDAKEVQTVSQSASVSKSDRYDLKVNPETRKILAKKLEDYLDARIEIVDKVQPSQKKDSPHKKRFRLLSNSSVKFRDESYVDTYEFTVKRKLIPLHEVESEKLSSAISPKYDISNMLRELQPVKCDVIL